MLGAETPGDLRVPGELTSKILMRFKATLSPPRVSVGARAVGDLTCEASESGITKCRPTSVSGAIEGLDEGSCVSLETGTWHAPGLDLHGQNADIRGHKSDASGQQWAYVGSSNVVVPACTGRVPNPAEAEQIRKVHVGKQKNDGSCVPPPTANCPRGWRFNADTGECEPKPKSPAVWIENEGRIYGERKWYNERPGLVLERFSPEEGQFKGFECARVDLGGYTLVTTVACCRECAQGIECDCSCSCSGRP